MGLDKPVNANCIIRMQFLLQAYYPIVVIEKVQLSLDKASTIVELPLENKVRKVVTEYLRISVALFNKQRQRCSQNTPYFSIISLVNQ